MPDDDLQRAKLTMLWHHLRFRGISDSRVLEAMAKVPRERFVDASLQSDAYSDQALPIACEQTISQPFIVALMTQALTLQGDERVLEIGTGSGYQTAILAEMVSRVVSVERHAALSRLAASVLADLGYGRVKLVVGDGTLGWPDEAPYDRILVAAAAAAPPKALVNQLAPGGLLVIPIGGRDHQMLQTIRKAGDEIRVESLSACRFVPLVGEDAWPTE